MKGKPMRDPVHLPEELADKRTLRNRVRRAMDELEDLKGRKKHQPDGPGRPVHENEAGLPAGLQRPGYGFAGKDGPGYVQHADHGR